MKRLFLKIYLVLFINIITPNPVLSEVFIIAKVNQEIITNIDIDFEKKYLVSLNPNLNKLDKNGTTFFENLYYLDSKHRHNEECSIWDFYSS